MNTRIALYSALIYLLVGGSNTLFAQSPYETSWKKYGIIGGAGVITALVGSAVDNSVPPLTLQEIQALSRNDINWFDRSATYKWSERARKASDALVVTSFVVPLSLFLLDDIRSDWGTITTMYLETFVFAAFVPSFGKGGVQRKRPFVYNSDAPLEKKLEPAAKRSFFSGHTTWAFASAVFLSTVYSDYYPHSRWKPYIWGGSLLLATTVGFLRYESGAHFPTDVITGALVGSGIGYLIPWLHRKPMANVTLMPSPNTSGYGVLVSIKL